MSAPDHRPYSAAMSGHIRISRMSISSRAVSMGWQPGVVVPLAGGFEIVGQMDGLYGEAFSTGIVVRRTGTARPWLYAVEAGPRYSVQSSGRISPFIEAL